MVEKERERNATQTENHFEIPGTEKIQVNSHQLREQPIALESNELKINQQNEENTHKMNFANGLNLNSQLKNIEEKNRYARLANEYGVDDINSMNGETSNETNLFIYAAVERVTHISNCITCLNIRF